MSFRINLGNWGSVFAVPSSVVDVHLRIAGAQQLKVLLYMLRNGDKKLTYEKISEDTNIMLGDVKDSITFWVERGLLVRTEDEVLPSDSETSSVIPSETTTDTVKSVRPLTRQPRPDFRFVSQRLTEDPALTVLMDEAQNALQKPLSSGEVCTLYMLSDTYGLPAEVILMLIGYSASIGKANINFIEKEGIRWSDDGIDDIEKAEERITALKNRYSAWGTVAGIFGIKSVGSPTKTQLAFADCWLNEWKFSSDMLREAYERCVDSKNECDLKYINGILKNWQKKGIKSPDDIAVKDVPKRVKKSAEKNSSYDINDLDGDSIFDD